MPKYKGANTINDTVQLKSKLQPTEINTGKTNGKTAILHCRTMTT